MAAEAGRLLDVWADVGRMTGYSMFIRTPQVENRKNCACWHGKWVSPESYWPMTACLSETSPPCQLKFPDAGLAGARFTPQILLQDAEISPV